MSFYRFIYYCALVGGWCALLGWLVSELVIPAAKRNQFGFVILLTSLVGAGIGAGIMTISGTGKGQWYQRMLPGLIGGIVCGAIGGLIGNGLVRSDLQISIGKWDLRLLTGWVLMGLCIGSIEGAYQQSLKKLRNGLIGGGLGGLIGGFLLERILNNVETNHGYTSRAAAFVVLGLAIGCLIGLVQVAFREAWLTVIDGFRPGRQLILSESKTTLGKGEWVALPFMGNFGKALEPEHLIIIRGSDGTYSAEDNGTESGSEVNRQKIHVRTPLSDGDTIRIGNNIIRFNEKSKKDHGQKGRGRDRDRNDDREDSAPRQPTRSGAPMTLPPPPPPAPRAEKPAPPPPPKPQADTKPAPAPLPLPKPASESKPVPPPVKSEPEIKPPAPKPVAPPPKPTVETKPPPPAPPKPAPPPPPKPTAPTASPGSPPPASAEEGCPGCKRKIPGAKGTRYCMVCDVTF